MPRIIYSKLNFAENNFYVLRGNARDLIRGKKCNVVAWDVLSKIWVIWLKSSLNTPRLSLRYHKPSKYFSLISTTPSSPPPHSSINLMAEKRRREFTSQPDVIRLENIINNLHSKWVSRISEEKNVNKVYEKKLRDYKKYKKFVAFLSQSFSFLSFFPCFGECHVLFEF